MVQMGARRKILGVLGRFEPQLLLGMLDLIKPPSTPITTSPNETIQITKVQCYGD